MVTGWYTQPDGTPDAPHPNLPHAPQARAIRTDACVLEVVRVAEERLGVPRRAHAT